MSSSLRRMGQEVCGGLLQGASIIADVVSRPKFLIQLYYQIPQISLKITLVVAPPNILGIVRQLLILILFRARFYGWLGG